MEGAAAAACLPRTQKPHTSEISVLAAMRFGKASEVLLQAVASSAVWITASTLR